VAFSIGANLTMRVGGFGAHGNVGRGGGTALRDLFSGQIRFDFLIWRFEAILFRIEGLVVLVGGLVFGELRREFDAALAKIAISRLKQRWARQVVSARG
jgi:hypothetical protein